MSTMLTIYNVGSFDDSLQKHYYCLIYIYHLITRPLSHTVYKIKQYVKGSIEYTMQYSAVC